MNVPFSVTHYGAYRTGKGTLCALSLTGPVMHGLYLTISLARNSYCSGSNNTRLWSSKVATAVLRGVENGGGRIGNGDDSAVKGFMNLRLDPVPVMRHLHRSTASIPLHHCINSTTQIHSINSTTPLHQFHYTTASRTVQQAHYSKHTTSKHTLQQAQCSNCTTAGTTASKLTRQ